MSPSHLFLVEDVQQVVEREASRLEDKISAVLLKLTSQNQQLVSGGTGDQLLDLGPGSTSVRWFRECPQRLPGGVRVAKDHVGPSRGHLRADKVKSWIQHNLSVQNVSSVMQSPLSCGTQEDINTSRPLTQHHRGSGTSTRGHLLIKTKDLSLRINVGVLRCVGGVFSPGTCSERKAECLETKSFSC